MPHITEAASGALLITLPLPFELNHVNVGLIRAADGWMLIDTGMRSEESLNELDAALASIGVAWRDVKTLVLTHMHPDHVGMTSRIVELSGARIAMHRAEADQLNAIVAAGRPPWIDTALEIAGTPRDMWRAVDRSLSGMRDALREIHPDIRLEGGEEFPTALGATRVVWTPGHSVGHICLYWPQAGLLYAGDHILESMTPNIGWLPGRDMLGEYLNSLTAVESLPIRRVLPSHGAPFSGHTEWIRQTRRHHQERCDRIAQALAGGSKTAHELVPKVWERELSLFHYYFAVNEALAHLEHMHHLGVVAAERSEAGALDWSVNRELPANA